MRARVALFALLVCGCHEGATPAQTALPSSLPVAPSLPPPRFMLPIAELYERRDDAIIRAPDIDQAVARGYPSSPARGEARDGLQMTILTARAEYRVGEEVRVIHIVEAARGHESYVMGPKEVFGEYIDDVLRTRDAVNPTYPWTEVYDGAVLPGPNVDTNFEVTRYRFDAPGRHRIAWRIGAMRSNVIEFTVR